MIALDEKVFIPGEKPESYPLSVYFNGLSHLYCFIKGEEERMLKEHPNVGLLFPASDRDDIILNHFIWYCNNFVPFIDLFSRAYAPKENLRQEFHAVKKWRDKVAAHPSLVKPRQDSAMVQTASVNQLITWSNGRFSVGREVSWSVDTGGSTPDDWGWELTDVHERVLSILKGYT